MPDPPVEIYDNLTGESTPLWNVQQNQSSRQSNPRVDSIYSQGSDETFLVGLEEQEQIQINGRATGLRISQHVDYSSDPLFALAEFIGRLLAHVNGNQGSGTEETNFEVHNSYTGRSLPVVFEEISVIKRRTEKYECDYALKLRIGESMMPRLPLDPPTINPRTTARVAGVELDEVEEMMITKRQKLTPHTYVTAGETGLTFEDVQYTSQTGAVQEFDLRGSITGDESDRQAFDDAIRSKTGENVITTFESHFPGADYDVMIANHDSVREAGVTQLGKYSLKLIEGTVGAPM